VIDEEYVLLASRISRIDIAKERLENVTVQLQRIEAVADTLDGVELDAATDEMAPVWRP